MSAPRGDPASSACTVDERCPRNAIEKWLLSLHLSQTTLPYSLSTAGWTGVLADNRSNPGNLGNPSNLGNCIVIVFTAPVRGV
jgi:hypothetical protein